MPTEGINSLLPESLETPQLKEAAEAPQTPRFQIPIESGRVYDKSFRTTEAEATMYNQIDWRDLRKMKNLSGENAKKWQISDEDTGNTFIVDAEKAKAARSAFKAYVADQQKARAVTSILH